MYIYTIIVYDGSNQLVCFQHGELLQRLRLGQQVALLHQLLAWHPVIHLYASIVVGKLPPPDSTQTGRTFQNYSSVQQRHTPSLEYTHRANPCDDPFPISMTFPISLTLFLFQWHFLFHWPFSYFNDLFLVIDPFFYSIDLYSINPFPISSTLFLFHWPFSYFIDPFPISSLFETQLSSTQRKGEIRKKTTQQQTNNRIY